MDDEKLMDANSNCNDDSDITDQISNLNLLESKDYPTEVSSLPCTSVASRKKCWEPSQTNDSHCSCAEDNNERDAICPVCFLLQQVDDTYANDNITSSGSKRKHDMACGGPLHAQMHLSQKLVEESATWSASTKTLSKKARIPRQQQYERLLTEDAMNIHDMAIAALHRCDISGDLANDVMQRGTPDVQDMQHSRNEMNTIDTELAFEMNVLNDLHLSDEEKDVDDTTPHVNQPTEEYSFTLLPAELKLKIFSYLSQRELCRYVAPICSLWFRLAKDISLWQHVDIQRDFEDISNDLLVHLLVAWCPHLTQLQLDKRNTLTTSQFRDIFEHCGDIMQLSLAFCTQIDSEVLTIIRTHLKKLQNINLEGCANTNDSSFYSFVGLPLISVNVSYCNMISDDGGMFLVRNFSGLKEVNFDGIQWMSEDFVRLLVALHHETLEKVFLDGENLGDSSVRELSRCKKLRAMSFSFCNSMSHHAIEWVGQCSRLAHLQLRKGNNFTNSSLLTYIRNMSPAQGLRFNYLNLAECSEISDKCLFQLSERCPNLEVLDLSWCWEVSDDGLAHIIDNCHSLKQLYLRGLHELYGTPFFRLPRCVPHLVVLDLNQCNKVDDELIQHIVEKMKDLIITNYYGETVINTRHKNAHRYMEI